MPKKTNPYRDPISPPVHGLKKLRLHQLLNQNCGTGLMKGRVHRSSNHSKRVEGEKKRHQTWIIEAPRVLKPHTTFQDAEKRREASRRDDRGSTYKGRRPTTKAEQGPSYWTGATTQHIDMKQQPSFDRKAERRRGNSNRVRVGAYQRLIHQIQNQRRRIEEPPQAILTEKSMKRERGDNQPMKLVLKSFTGGIT